MVMKLILIPITISLLYGCGATGPSLKTEEININDEGKMHGISYGLIKRDLIIGESTQEDVVRKYGSPNNMVYSGKSEIWIYDQIFTESQLTFESNNSGITVGGIGTAGAGLIGASAGIRNSQGKTRSTSAVKMLTVILEFDPKGLLKDVSARKGGY